MAMRKMQAVSGLANRCCTGFLTITPMMTAGKVATISRSNVADLVADLRSRHDYVVIDAGNLPQNSFGLLLIGSADVALVAFRAGRSQQIADRAMLDALVDDARARGYTRVRLNAQDHAIDFYAKAGFTPYGATLMECDILHQPMELAL